MLRLSLLLSQCALAWQLVDGFSVDPSKVSPSPSRPPNNAGAGSGEPEDWVAFAFQQQEPPSEEDNVLSEDPLRSAQQPVVGPQQVLIYDTTLRDGTQGESVSCSVDDKLKIAKRLAAFGVDYIEAGWPGSNPKDATFFARAVTELSAAERQRLAAFGSTRRKNLADITQDAQVQALLECGAPTLCIVAKSHAWQVTDILRTTLDENLAMIRDTVAYLSTAGGKDDDGRLVMVDLEHFFDGYQFDPDYAVQCCLAATEAGAACLVLCDTNGGTMPWDVERIVMDLRKRLEANENVVTLGIHCHNDCGMAVANSMMAVKAGVGLVQGTINGIGERTGNADLCSIVPSLALKPVVTNGNDENNGNNSQMTCRSHLSEITTLSRFVDEILNRTPNHAAPYVGASAFAHKGGLHVAAMKRSSASYQHAEPTDVGNQSRVLISELSGRQNILGKVEKAMHDRHDENDDDGIASDRAMSILNRVKQLEAKGYTFEGAEASVDLMILHASKGYCSPFQVLDYSAQVYDARMDSASRFFMGSDDSDEGVCDAAAGLGPTARATVKVRTVESQLSKWTEETAAKPNEILDENDDALDDTASSTVIHERLEVSDGNGPVDALANALMRALQPVHPSLQNVELVDYKVRILDPESATGAATRVLIEFRDTERESTWTTVSVDTNVISASLNALIDGFEYALVDYANDSCLLFEGN